MRQTAAQAFVLTAPAAGKKGPAGYAGRLRRPPAALKRFMRAVSGVAKTGTKSGRDRKWQDGYTGERQQSGNSGSAGLAFGSFGFRKPASISVKKTTLELLKKLKLGKYIRMEEEPDKEAMFNMDDDALAQADAARKIKDVFFRVQSRTGRASGLKETDTEAKRNPARRTVSGFEKGIRTEGDTRAARCCRKSGV
jgi:hypothetical protein